MKILLAEDDQKLAKHVIRGLSESSHVVDHANDGEEAVWLAESFDYDVMVLDIMMPQKDGLTAVRQLRKGGNQTPIVLLTARNAVEDRVGGLDAGADDYLVKPFSMAELLARIRAVTRRTRGENSLQLKVGPLELDLVGRQLFRDGRKIELTNREFALLELLMVSAPNPVGKTTITEKVWDQHFDSGTNLVNVYINHLRKKIDKPNEESLIRTIRGIGFAIE